ncbi:MAG: ATP-binding cassette domain-containing protein [Myxococcota bacterium]
MIELIDVSKHFGDVVAVDRISLSVQEGELLILLGGSGSGKTTTMRMVNRLIEPTTGRIEIDGVDNKTMTPAVLRRQVGYAFQKIGLFPHMTVAENIAITPTLLGWRRADIDQRVDELLEMVELPAENYRDRWPRELSGGQQQRVGVARALAAKPRVMLLDEPFGALDPLTRDRLQDAFTRIRRQLNLTAIFVTHDMTEALLLGDRIAVMNEGQLVQVGTPHELLTAPADDYIRELMATPRRQSQAVEAMIQNA